MVAWRVDESPGLEDRLHEQNYITEDAFNRCIRLKAHFFNMTMMHFLNVIASYIALVALLVSHQARSSAHNDSIAYNADPDQIIVKIVYNLHLHPLRCYPGPKLWAATRITWACAMQFGNYHKRLHAMHERYGHVVRVAPDELSFIEPQAWKDIFGNRNITKNSTWTGNQEKDHPISIVSTDEATHLRNRRALTGAFTEHAIAEHASVLENLVQVMIEQFKEAVSHGERPSVVNAVDWFNWLTFDISGALSFGKSFESVRSGRAHPWVDISCNFGKGIALMASINFFYPMNKVLKLAMPRSVMEKMRYHKQLAHEMLLQRLSMGHKTNAQDYVGSIMAYNEEKGEVKIPQEEIEANMTLLIFAGSETTSSAMSAILTEMLRSPEALRKATEEVRSAFATEEAITVASTAKLEYLTAIIQEGIRMGPPAAVGVPRVVQKGGATIVGQYVPAGVSLPTSLYSATNTLTFPQDFCRCKPVSSIPVFGQFFKPRVVRA